MSGQELHDFAVLALQDEHGLPLEAFDILYECLKAEGQTYITDNVRMANDRVTLPPDWKDDK